MKAKELVWRLTQPDMVDADVMVQLPNNEPPVDFRVESFSGYTFDGFREAGTVILLPVPPDGGVWDHDNNVIRTERERP